MYFSNIKVKASNFNSQVMLLEKLYDKRFLAYIKEFTAYTHLEF